MAVGAAFLARKKAIVQKLTAIESLAGVDVLCTDKTGTLTANQLSVHERMPLFYLIAFVILDTDYYFTHIAWAAEGVDLNWMYAILILCTASSLVERMFFLSQVDRCCACILAQYQGTRPYRQGYRYDSEGLSKGKRNAHGKSICAIARVPWRLIFDHCTGRMDDTQVHSLRPGLEAHYG